MTLTDEQRKARLSIRADKIKEAISKKLRQNCDNWGITYNESDTNAQLCEKLNS